MRHDSTQKLLFELQEYIHRPRILQGKMDFYEKREDYLTWRHNTALEDKYTTKNIEYILKQYSATPEEILLEKERQQEIIDLLLYIKATIGEEDFNEILIGLDRMIP